MKRQSSLFRRAMAGSSVMVACVGFPLAAVSAQTNSSAAAPSANSIKTPMSLPYGVSEVTQMFQKGVSTPNILRYVRDTAVPYQFSAEEIVYLHNLGMPAEIIDAMIQRGAQLANEHEVPPPIVVVNVGSEDPYYAADYYPYDDDFDWPYYYGGSIFIGGGYGYGHGGFHGHGFHGGGFHGGGFGGFHGGGFGGFHGGGGGGHR